MRERSRPHSASKTSPGRPPLAQDQREIPRAFSPELPPILIVRVRLLNLWDKCETVRLVLVQAPAGWGKTVFLAMKITGSRDTLWWGFQDVPDPGTAAFARHLGRVFGFTPPPPGEGFALALAESVARVLSGAGASGTAPDASPGSTSPKRNRSWRLNLVIEDIESAEDVPVITLFLDLLAPRLPASCSLFVASREKLDIGSGRLRAEGKVLDVGQDILRCTRDEARLFFEGLEDAETSLYELTGDDPASAGPKPAITEAQLDRVMRLMEGWPAGLGLLRQYLDGPPQRSIDSALDEIEGAGTRWFEYLRREVFEKLPADVQEFMLQVSVLSLMTASRCNRLAGIDSSGAMLDRLCRMNAFIFPVAPRASVTPGEKVLRFHNLFRGFLVEQLRTVFGESKVRELYTRAASCHAGERNWMDAAVCLTRAGENAAALEILEEHGEELIDRGRMKPLDAAFAVIGEPLWGQRVRALLVLGRLRAMQSREPEAAQLFERASALAADGPAEPWVQVLYRQAELHVRRGHCREAVALCKKVRGIRAKGREEIPRQLRGRLMVVEANARSQLGEIDHAENLLQDAAAVTADPNELARIEYYTACGVDHPRGETRTAAERLERAEQTFGLHGDERFLRSAMSMRAIMLCHDGREPEARRLAEEAMEAARKLGLKEVQGTCFRALGWCARIRGDLAEARRQYDQARLIGDACLDTDLRTFPRLAIAEIARMEGDIDGALNGAAFASLIAGEVGAKLAEAVSLIVMGRCMPLRVSLGPPRDPNVCHPRPEWADAEKMLSEMMATGTRVWLWLLRIEAGDIAEADLPRFVLDLINTVRSLQLEALLLVHEREAGARALGAALRMGVERRWVVGMLRRMGDAAVDELRKCLEFAGAAGASGDGGGNENGVGKCAGDGNGNTDGNGDREGSGNVSRSRDELLAEMCLDALAEIGTENAERVYAEFCRDAPAVSGETPRTIRRVGPIDIAKLDTAPTGPGIRVFAFGAMEVYKDGVRVERLCRPGRETRLLACLAAQPDSWIGVDVLGAALGRPHEKGLKFLDQVIWLVRDALGESAAGSCIERRVGEVRLALKQVAFFDVGLFKAVMDEAEALRRSIRSKRRAALADPPAGSREPFANAGPMTANPAPVWLLEESRAIPLLKTARALYRGPFLQGIRYLDFIDNERKVLRDRWLRGSGWLARSLARSKDWDEVIPVALEIRAAEPTHEGANACLILALRESGRLKDAVRAHAHYLKAVEKDAGAEPSPKVAALLSGIGRSGTTRRGAATWDLEG